MQLKKTCIFPFIHGSRFPGQGGPDSKCFLFKMATKGPGSGVELVNSMRRTGQGHLRNSWVHFDYTHRVDGWSTMSCSVYDTRFSFDFSAPYILHNGITQMINCMFMFGQFADSYDYCNL